MEFYWELKSFLHEEENSLTQITENPRDIFFFLSVVTSVPGWNRGDSHLLWVRVNPDSKMLGARGQAAFLFQF